MKLYVFTFASALLMLSLQAYAGQDMAKAMYEAVGAGNVAVVRNLLEAGTSVDERYRRLSPLEHALIESQLDTARLLLENGASISSSAGDLYFNSGIFCGHADLLQISLERCEISVASCEQGLHVAVQRGYVDLARIFLQHGVRANKDLLTLAVLKNDMAMAKLLLRHGVSPYCGRYTALLLDFACQERDTLLMQLLWQHATRPSRGLLDDAKSADREILEDHLKIALRQADQDVLQFMLECLHASERPEIASKALIERFIQDSIVVPIRLLLQHGAFLDEEPAAKWDVTGWALKKGYVDIAQTLVKRGANLTQEHRQLPHAALLAGLYEGRLGAIADCLSRAGMPAVLGALIAHMSGQSERQTNGVYELMR